MQNKKLWYVKRRASAHGPFPKAVVERHIVLGRIRPGDQLSNDGVNWSPYPEIPQFAALISGASAGRAFSRYDERQGERRQDSVDQSNRSNSNVRGPDRRRSEPHAVIVARSNSKQVWEGLRKPRERPFVPLLILSAASVVIFGLGFAFKPEPLVAGDCAAPPVPGVNWDSCNLERANLRRADLRGATLKNVRLRSGDLAGAVLIDAELGYVNLAHANLALANFSRARLIGANLQSADLSHANLQGADLKYSDLRDARLQDTDLAGARLDSAIWVDGRRCAHASIGQCVYE